MKINNDKFNKFLEEEKKINHQEETKHSIGEYYKWHKDADDVLGSISIDQDWLIGLMTSWLLDNGCYISKKKLPKFMGGVQYTVKLNSRGKLLSKNTDLFTALKDAIEVQE